MNTDNNYELIGVSELLKAIEETEKPPTITFEKLSNHLEKRSTQQEQITWTYVRLVDLVIEKKLKDKNKTQEEVELLDSFSYDFKIKVLEAHNKIINIRKELALAIKEKYDAISGATTIC